MKFYFWIQGPNFVDSASIQGLQPCWGTLTNLANDSLDTSKTSFAVFEPPGRSALSFTLVEQLANQNKTLIKTNLRGAGALDRTSYVWNSLRKTVLDGADSRMAKGSKQ
jgi:hypothetical protein